MSISLNAFFINIDFYQLRNQRTDESKAVIVQRTHVMFIALSLFGGELRTDSCEMLFNCSMNDNLIPVY